MNAVLLGATRGMGRALARLLVERGDTVCLLGRNPTDLERSARDLQVRGALPAPPSAFPCDLARPETFAPALDAAAESLGRLETVIVTAADFASQADLEADPERARSLAAIDFANTVGFCEHARRRLLAAGGGTLCVFSSVAGDRARSPVVVYGAAKAGLSAYLEGLDHRYHRQGLRTVCVKPGFVRTSMTAGLAPPPFAGDPDRVARRVVRAIDCGRPVVYAPPVWRWIMLAVRNLPRAVMRRVEF
ncbi:MAG: SDR family NAD(P)-dependent oxidoreductase [Acidobacteria bacterium]|nr:SDR family NAD(P)-dependent oxidoreductase [Acidobacteriota bacterium]